MAIPTTKNRDSAEKTKWSGFSVEEYRQIASRLVHFSAKAVNSNASAGGVRLCANDALPLNYVSARCLLSQGVALQTDYTGNGAQGGVSPSGALKQIRLLEDGENPGGLSEQEIDEILSAVKAAQAHRHEEGTDAVSPRLQQLLLPAPDGDYLAVTPLHCGGLSKIIKARVSAHNNGVANASKLASGAKQADDIGVSKTEGGEPVAVALGWYLKRGVISIGGSNTQNVGATAFDMQSVLVFAPPQGPQGEFKEALKIHYNGIPIVFSRKIINAWKKWHKANEKANGGVIRTNLRTRKREKGLLVASIRPLLRDGARALDVLTRHVERLPGKQLLSPSLNNGIVHSVVRGLIDPSERDESWAGSAGMMLADAIAAYAAEGKDPVQLDYSSISMMSRWFEEELR